MPAPTSQIPGVYRRRIGDITVTALSDGYLDGDLSVLQGINPAVGAAEMAAVFQPVRRTSVNSFVIHAGSRTALVDTGSGSYLGPTAGWLRRNLEAADVEPSEIDTILLTHMHPDHSAGLSDRNTGERLFPNAELVMHENEPVHWANDAAMNQASEREKLLYFQAGREQIAPYRSAMRLFESGDVFPGVTALPAQGHTPGHTAYLIASGDHSLLIWGDIVHVPDIQVAHPEVTIAFDTDPEGAAASRHQLFDMAASDRLLVTGMHLHFPGFSHLVRDHGGYRLLPESWDQAFK
ncbi:MAG: MBL fold metallo-hydrolase [Alphaproteobacteria bacterium]|nr:MBL fold metallo-hydrolase [Alphaproteobacteria bacterium]MCY4320733.1 MBL fold metallo-hydrolase [Alphaproteobacteria bacterium]